MAYTTLDPSQRQIRLLHLHAGQPKDYVTCHFSTISLDDHEIVYDALSYVWGETTEGRFVIVEGIQTEVTDNLWQALDGLRDLNKERILWVDALCINQSDDRERSDQVAHMNAIYTSASTVEIWLGEPYEGIETALRFIKEFATGFTADGEAVSYEHLGDTIPDDYDPDASDDELLDENGREAIALLRTVCEFAYRPWFGRVWTVQEFFLAKDSTFHCGAHTLNGATFKQALYHLGKHNKSCCAVRIPFGLKNELSNFFLFSHGLRQLGMIRMSFLECVSAFRFRKATNSRDKIYGLMGLGIEEATELVRPDYTLPVENVYEDFVIALLHRTKDLDVLSHLRNERPRDLILPTFVPDWSMDLSDLDDMETGSWSMRCSILANCDAANGKDVEYEARPGVLRIHGAVVDTVKTTANQTLDSVTVNASAPTWNSFLDETMQIAGIPPREQDPGLAKREAFWLTFVAGSEPQLRILPDSINDTQLTERVSDSWDRLSGLETDYHEGYENVLRTFDSHADADNAIPDAFYLIDNAAGVAQRGRKFTATEFGRMGLVPHHATKGDVVAVLTGGRVPIVLRPHEGYYTVVGDAYVHGIMDGEAFENLEELVWIELH